MSRSQAVLLASFLRRLNISVAEARAFTEYQWELAAMGARVAKPIGESRDLVLLAMMGVLSARKHEASSPETALANLSALTETGSQAQRGGV